ncbi:hypothetical protein ACK3TF_003786 [Chlorella vulgaris]
MDGGVAPLAGIESRDPRQASQLSLAGAAPSHWLFVSLLPGSTASSGAPKALTSPCCMPTSTAVAANAATSMHCPRARPAVPTASSERSRPATLPALSEVKMLLAWPKPRTSPNAATTPALSCTFVVSCRTAYRYVTPSSADATPAVASASRAAPPPLLPDATSGRLAMAPAAPAAAAALADCRRSASCGVRGERRSRGLASAALPPVAVEALPSTGRQAAINFGCGPGAFRIDNIPCAAFRPATR